MTQICGYCINAVQEEFSNPLDPDMAKVVAQKMGKDLPDHLCDAVEEPGAECGCACQDERSPEGFGTPHGNLTSASSGT